MIENRKKKFTQQNGMERLVDLITLSRSVSLYILTKIVIARNYTDSIEFGEY
jgi:hypothetical protein